MALFHLHLKQIGRKTKQGGSKSAAAVVAYRERAKIAEFDYRERGGFLRSYTLIPPEFEGTELAEILSTPDGFAEITEKTEKRKDSQLWDELEISLQKELSLAENVEILNQLVRETYTVRNQVARVFIHHPPETDNIHAHVLVIQRPLQKATNGGVELGKKIRQEFARGKPKSSEIVDLMRSRWAALCNTKFAEKGLNISISHESLKNQHENALAAGDLVKAAETDRPALYLPKSSRKTVSEVIVDNNGDYDFEANHQHFANVMKTKDLESLTIDFWLQATSFWANTRKIKINFRLARRKQRQKIQSIIKENLQNAIKYASEITQRRIAALSPAVSTITANIRSSVRNNQNAIVTSARLAALSEAESNQRSFAIERHRSDYNASGTRKTIQTNSGSYGNVRNVNPTAYDNGTIRIPAQSGSRSQNGTSSNSTYDLTKELDQALELRFKHILAPTPRRRR